MKYASTAIIDGVERVVVVLPLTSVQDFDPNAPPQGNTYAVADDVQVGWNKTADGTFSQHVNTPNEIRVEKRAGRAKIIKALTVTTAGGKVFNGDEDAQNRMVRVLKVADLTGQTSCPWVLADDTVETITKAELEEALSLAVQAMGAIWATPYQE